jgi:hypothetical protein
LEKGIYYRKFVLPGDHPCLDRRSHIINFISPFLKTILK